MSAVEDRLAELGLSVPEVAKPVAAYVPALQQGNLVYTSGQLPMRAGSLAATGKVGTGEGQVDPDTAKELAQTCALNAIAAVKGVVGDLDRVTQVVKVVGSSRATPPSRGSPASSTVRASCSARPSATPACTLGPPWGWPSFPSTRPSRLRSSSRSTEAYAAARLPHPGHRAGGRAVRAVVRGPRARSRGPACRDRDAGS